MAGAPTPYVPSTTGLYGNNPLPNQITAPPNLLQGLGVGGGLNTSAITSQLQQFNPTQLDTSNINKISDWDNVINSLMGKPGGTLLGSGVGMLNPSGLDGYTGSLSGLEADRDAVNNAMKTTQNNNLAGYNTTNAANAKDLGYLQQASIAQNRLLGQLNSRGLLNSFENGGAGTADMQQLQNTLNGSVQDQGLGLQNELNGLNQNDAMYQMALANYNSEMNNFSNAQKQNIPGLSDILGLGVSALSLA